MKKLISFLILFVLFILLTQLLFSKENNLFPKPINHIEDTTYSIFALQNNGYGFNISTGKKILIHQPFIPALQGNHGFATKKDAEKTARLMLYKLKKFGMPPTISTAELDSLHIHLN